MLIAAIAVLGLVVAVGAWLARGYLLTDEPPKKLHWTGLAHGAAGAVGLAVLAAALRAPLPAHAIKMGAGRFGVLSAALMASGLVAGVAILVTHLRRKPVSAGLVAAHGMLGISGYTLLVTYLSMLR